ncbi:MAG TPA: DUF5777 family beta-barrel protein [Cyclobacteriaceae bacterium]|nr:DUF5777 family beta-barrel protein [Cyclobacteriaceae bacterium]
MKFSTILFCFLCLSITVAAQDDLLKELEKSQAPEVEYIEQTFKGTRLVNGQSVETKGQGELEFIFAHRFGPMNGGLYELFGLDQAYVRLGLEYGVTDRLGFGFGRNSVDKTMDAYGRLKVLRQSKGAKVMPVTITAFGQAAIKMSPRKEDDPTGTLTTVNRMSYTAQLLIARKFNSKLSLQLMPTMIHRNRVDQTIEDNDQFAIGVGGRLKVSRSVALTTEYYYRLNTFETNPNKDVLGFGIDIETGGHVFQLVLTNTRGLTERAWLTETTGDFFDGDIHLGFNITRTFQLAERK